MKRKNLLFAVMTALFLLAAPNLRAASSGTCGDNVKWTLNSNGVLTISGTGAMSDYTDDSPAPWTDLSFTSAVIKDGVTTIGDQAFYECSELTSVTIPSTVTSIGESAFDFCVRLTSVDIPNSVTSIGDFAFYGCEKLTSVTIPNSVTNIGEQVFLGCSGLTSVTIPSSVTSLGYYAFAYCEGLEKIESLAETPPTCGSDAFELVDKNKCVLSVPKNSVKAYKAAEGWKDFSNIVTGIVGVAQENNVGVSAKNGEITVTGVAGNAVVEVYSTGGTQVYRGTSKTIAVPSAGTYIVRAAGKTFKVNTAK